jgi:hypothetical protein
MNYSHKDNKGGGFNMQTYEQLKDIPMDVYDEQLQKAMTFSSWMVWY